MDNITKEQLMVILVQRRWNFFTKEEKWMLLRALSTWESFGTGHRPPEFYKLRDELANDNVIL
jgi:hypothetical protein